MLQSYHGTYKLVTKFGSTYFTSSCLTIIYFNNLRFKDYNKYIAYLYTYTHQYMLYNDGFHGAFPGHTEDIAILSAAVMKRAILKSCLPTRIRQHRPLRRASLQLGIAS